MSCPCGTTLIQERSSPFIYFKGSVSAQELSSLVHLLGGLGRRSDIMGTMSVFSLMTHPSMSKKFFCFWPKSSELLHLPSKFRRKNNIPSMRNYSAKTDAQLWVTFTHLLRSPQKNCVPAFPFSSCQKQVRAEFASPRCAP